MITYYGMLAEKLNLPNETLEIPSGDINFRDFLQSRHPSLNGLTFSIAIDLEYGEMIGKNDLPKKIDVMPPFSGG